MKNSLAAHASVITLLLLAPAFFFAQVTIPNSGFEQADHSSATGLGKWNVAGNGGIASADSVTTHKGRYSLKFTRTAPAGQGNFYQDLPFTCPSLKKFKISCAMRAEGLAGEAGLGARIFDKDGNTITGYNAISITQNQDWKIMEGEFYSDEKAATVKIFGNISGAGTVWFDAISIEEIVISESKPAEKVLKYIDEYFNFITKYSVVKDKDYISRLKQNTQKLCAGHDDLDYCQNIMKRYTTLKLNDGHSFFWTANEWKQYNKGSANTALAGLVNYASGYLTKEHIAYLNVPTFASLDSKILQSYVDSLQLLIKNMDLQDPKGWIVDLSNNSGGNAFAMITGLGPLLGNGICGYSQSADGSKRTRMYKDGYSGWYPDTTLAQKSPVYRLVHKDLSIAVIYSEATGSAGEVTAISFRGKEHTKSFGQSTAGATTRVDNLVMSDGATLNLACGWDADRTGKVYKSRVPPDLETGNQKEALAKATEWIIAETGK